MAGISDQLPFDQQRSVKRRISRIQQTRLTESTVQRLLVHGCALAKRSATQLLWNFCVKGLMQKK